MSTALAMAIASRQTAIWAIARAYEGGAGCRRRTTRRCRTVGVDNLLPAATGQPPPAPQKEASIVFDSHQDKSRRRCALIM
jgi:hypothetical protein